MPDHHSELAQQALPLTLAPRASAEPSATRPLPTPTYGRKGDRFSKFSLEEELKVLAVVRASLTAHHEELDDPELMMVLAEGETSLLETIDAALESDLRDEGLISGLKACKDTLAVRLSRLEERRRSRRAILEQALSLLETKALERPTATMTLAERPPSLVVDEEARIPARFFDLKPTLNRRLAKEALAAGEDVPGARLADRTLTLTVRRR